MSQLTVLLQKDVPNHHGHAEQRYVQQFSIFAFDRGLVPEWLPSSQSMVAIHSSAV